MIVDLSKIFDNLLVKIILFWMFVIILPTVAQTVVNREWLYHIEPYEIRLFVFAVWVGGLAIYMVLFGYYILGSINFICKGYIKDVVKDNFEVKRKRKRKR